MRPIPKKMREEMAEDPFMKRCIYDGCYNKPEWEHAFVYANRQINEKWAIVPVCKYHHRGPGLDKTFNQHAALQRATEDDLHKYPRRDWRQLKKFLENKYE